MSLPIHILSSSIHVSMIVTNQTTTSFLFGIDFMSHTGNLLPLQKYYISYFTFLPGNRSHQMFLILLLNNGSMELPGSLVMKDSPLWSLCIFLSVFGFITSFTKNIILLVIHLFIKTIYLSLSDVSYPSLK